MHSVRTIYRNAPGPDGRPALNENGCAVAVGTAEDGTLAISVVGYGGPNANQYGHDAFAVIDRAEARALYEALGRELADG